MNQSQNSKMVKAGSRTYFFDVKEAKNGKKYLVITESRLAGEGKERVRNTIVIFSEQMGEFIGAVSEMAQYLG